MNYVNESNTRGDEFANLMCDKKLTENHTQYSFITYYIHIYEYRYIMFK